MTDDQPMTAEQAATLKRLAEAAYELDAFKIQPHYLVSRRIRYACSAG
jgi:hypothetical protein